MTRHAIILALLAGCGQVKGPGGGGGDGDGGAGDGGGGPDAAVPGVVEVTVLTDNGSLEPKEDVPVIFIQPDGASVDATTDEDGHASAEVLPGSAVFVFTNPDAVGVAQRLMLVALAVEPGDHITFGRTRANSGDVTAQMTIRLPVAKSVDFEVRTPCGSFGSGTRDVVVTFYDWCDDSPTGIVGLTHAGDSTYEVVGEEIAVIDDPDASDPAVVDDEWQLVTSPDVTVEGLHDVEGMTAIWRTARVSERNLDLALAGAEGLADTDTLTLSPPKIAGPDDVLLHLSVSDEQVQLGYQDYYLWRESGGDTDPVLLDMAELAMPRVGSAYFDLESRTFGFPLVGEGAWDATYLNLLWQDYDDSGEKVPPTYGTVRIVAPPGVTEVVLPPMPEEWSDWLPDTIDWFTPVLMIMDSDALDWDAARQLGFGPWYLDYPFAIEPATVRYARSRVVDG